MLVAIRRKMEPLPPVINGLYTRATNTRYLIFLWGPIHIDIPVARWVSLIRDV